MLSAGCALYPIWDAISDGSGWIDVSEEIRRE